MRVRIISVLTVMLVLVAWLALNAHAGETSDGVQTVPVTYSIAHVRDGVGVPGLTFESVVPVCGCSRRTVIAQYSLSTGRRLRTLAIVRTNGQISKAASDRHGNLWMTFTTGPHLAAVSGST